MQKLEKQIYKKNKSYKISKPFEAKVLAIKLINQVAGLDQAYHIVLDISGAEMNFLPGQSIGVIPPGEREDGRTHKPRLYSIASASPTEQSENENLALCVKRLVLTEDEAEPKFGLCSNYLCKLKPGDKLLITGPTGRIMLPPMDNKTDLILIATGTGVAPFRGFMQTYARALQPYQGEILQYYGFKYEEEALYCNQLNSDLIDLTNQTKAQLNLAFSRQQKNPAGGRMYVSDLIAKDEAKLAEIISRDNFAIYVCGLKGMENGILETLASWANQAKLDANEYIQQLKQTGRLNLEVY